MYSSPVRLSAMTAWRWPNVPRRLSWPTSRTVLAVEEHRAEGEQLAGGPVDRILLDSSSPGAEAAASAGDAA
jgi:hypothetical protein